MCGRFTLTVSPEILQEWFETQIGVEFPPRFNIAPTQPVLVVLEDREGRAAILARWGYVPVWVKDATDFPLLVNARAETLDIKPAFRGALRHHRCIVPASGYYEWRRARDGRKQPFYVTRTDCKLMALAAIHSDWLGADGSEIDTVGLITVAANPSLSTIHHRMPALIPDDAIADWLDLININANKASEMLRPAPDEFLTFHPVSTRVNSAGFDNETAIEPVDVDETPAPKKVGGGQLDLF